MIAVDTETTSLYWKHGATCFAIGSWDGNTFNSQRCNVNPLTRRRTQRFDAKEWRAKLDSHDVVVMHNASFDVKALCEAGVYGWDEPNNPAFWEKICDTSILSHLHDSSAKQSLKHLTIESLGEGYDEVDELDRIVQRVRIFVGNRREDWLLANKERRHPALVPCGTNTRWHKMDMWLCHAVLQHFQQSELKNYFGEDYYKLDTVLLEYLKKDCVSTYELATSLFHALLERHDEDVVRLLNVNNNIRHIVWGIETNGITVKSDRLQAAITTCEEEADRLLSECKTLSGRDKLDDGQIRDLLFNEWKLPPVKFTKPSAKFPNGQPSADAKSLLQLRRSASGTAHSFIGHWIAYKKYNKKLEALTGYARASLAGTLYPSMHATGTQTTRFSSSNPNGQNIEKKPPSFDDDEDINQMLEKTPGSRSVFGPPKGKWWIAMDYSQLQLRIFAVVTDEKGMQEAFRQGWDGHDYTMHRIFSDVTEHTELHRRIAKNTNFGFVFGASPKKIEETAGRPGLWDVVTEMFPNAHRFIQQTKQSIGKDGYVYTLGGYPLRMDLVTNKYTGRKEYKAHAGVNYIVQGSEGIIVKEAMFLCDKYLKESNFGGRICMLIHDEIVFEVPAFTSKVHVRKLKECMEQAATNYGVYAPVDAELITDTWAAKKGIEL